MRSGVMIRSIASALLIAALGSSAGAASGAAFSFRGIEFAPVEQRLPAAQAYLREYAAPGTPLVVAIAAVRHAEAACSKRLDADGAIRCRYSRVASDSLADLPLGDVTWTVRLYPDPDGRIAQATVERERVGL